VSMLYRVRDVGSYLLNVTDFNYPSAFGFPVWVTPVEFRGDIDIKTLESRGIVSVIDAAFSRFNRTSTCDRQTQTDRQTDRHKTTAYTAQSELAR